MSSFLNDLSKQFHVAAIYQKRHLSVYCFSLDKAFCKELIVGHFIREMAHVHILEMFK